MRDLTTRNAAFTLMLTGLVTALAAPSAALAQDPWIVAPEDPVQSGEMVEFAFGIGHQFPNSDRPIPPALVEKWVVVGPKGDETIDLLSPDGNDLFVNPLFRDAGIYTIAVSTKPEYVQLDPLRFDDYLKAQKASDAYKRIHERGLEKEPGRELRSYYAKTFMLVGEGGGKTYNLPVGQRLELVPTSDPTNLRHGQSITFRVLLDGKPAEGIRTCSGHVGRHEYNYFTQVRSNVSGHVEFMPNRPGQWYVRATLIRPATERTIADWRATGSIINDDPLMPPSLHARPEENPKIGDTSPESITPEWESFFSTASFYVR